MKKSITPLLLLFALSSTGFSEVSAKQSRISAAQKVEAYYKQAEEAFNNGDKQATAEALRSALQINPKHGPSYALALKLKKSGPAFKVQARQRQLASVILTEVDLKETPLSEALQTLATLIEEKSEKKIYPNFVIQDQSGKLKNIPVTLNLKNVPASVVLEYLMKQSQAAAKYSEYAITVRPLKR